MMPFCHWQVNRCYWGCHFATDRWTGVTEGIILQPNRWIGVTEGVILPPTGEQVLLVAPFCHRQVNRCYWWCHFCHWQVNRHYWGCHFATDRWTGVTDGVIFCWHVNGCYWWWCHFATDMWMGVTDDGVILPLTCDWMLLMVVSFCQIGHRPHAQLQSGRLLLQLLGSHDRKGILVIQFWEGIHFVQFWRVMTGKGFILFTSRKPCQKMWSLCLLQGSHMMYIRRYYFQSAACRQISQVEASWNQDRFCPFWVQALLNDRFCPFWVQTSLKDRFCPFWVQASLKDRFCPFWVQASLKDRVCPFWVQASLKDRFCHFLAQASFKDIHSSFLQCLGSQEEAGFRKGICCIYFYGFVLFTLLSALLCP